MKEELKLAIEALKKTQSEGYNLPSMAISEAILVAEAVLAQPEQEPWGACLSGRVFVGKLPEHVRKLAEDNGLTIQWLYTTPPQRKPLTDEQIDAIDVEITKAGYCQMKFARAIEKAHGIKE